LDRTLPGRFASAGDSRVDMPVWARASEAIYVGGARWARRMARRLGKPARIFAVPSRLPPLLRAARPHQWVKNTLVFVPAILGGRIFQPEVLGEISLAFAALCLIASGSYMLNDVWDVADDRRHWSKRHRPIASGDLPIVVALRHRRRVRPRRRGWAGGGAHARRLSRADPALFPGAEADRGARCDGAGGAVHLALHGRHRRRRGVRLAVAAGVLDDAVRLAVLRQALCRGGRLRLA